MWSTKTMIRIVEKLYSCGYCLHKIIDRILRLKRLLELEAPESIIVKARQMVWKALYGLQREEKIAIKAILDVDDERPEERLLRAIFGKKAREIKDTSQIKK